MSKAKATDVVKIGRPSLRTPEVVDKICQQLAQGVPLAVLCREPGMPHPTTVGDWGRADAAVSLAIAHARLEGFDVIAHRLRCTARGEFKPGGGESTGDVARDKLIIDTDIKMLSKWDPKRYGDKVGVVGSDGDGPVQIAIAVAFRRALPAPGE